MSVIRAIIIDDEQAGINSLTLLLARFVTGVKLVASTTDPVQGIELIESFRPEIVFLDINMPFLNGFELLEKLSFRDFFLIFTTAHNEYGLKAIKENALDYLLKPVDKEDLDGAIARVRKKMNEKTVFPDLEKLIRDLSYEETQRIPISTKDGIEYKEMEEVVRLEANSNYTSIVLANKQKYLVPKTLKEYEKVLCANEKKFMRIHQSHIINLQHVTRYYKENGGLIEMKDGAKLPLSKNKKEDFLQWLNI